MSKKKKTQKRKKSFSPIKFLLTMAVFVVAVALIIEFVDFKAIFNFSQNSQESQSNPSGNSQSSANQSQPESNSNSSTTTEPKEDKPQYEGNNPNSSNDITGIISHNSVQNNKLVLRVAIDQFLSSGACSLKMTHQDGTVYQATANIAESASTSTCEGFDIPTSALKSGKWQIDITVNSNGKSGVISGEAKI